MLRNLSTAGRGRTRGLIAFVTAGVALSLLAGCASGPAGSAASKSTATAGAATTVPAGATFVESPTPGPFVCANPAGSSARYAYVAADHQLTLVKGCSPREIQARPARALSPQAFSPSGQWLLADESTADWNSTINQPQCETLINTATYSVTITPFCDPSVPDPAMGWYGFIGWGTDTTYYVGLWGPDATVTVIRVSAPGMSATPVRTFPWVANLANHSTESGIVLKNGALYYAGYASASDHEHAWLRRYDLTTGADARIVSLGIAGPGGCQVQVDNTPCLWSGSWDISPDGSRVVYFNPGPTQLPTDTYVAPTTPSLLYIAKNDGSSATRLFAGVTLGGSFTQPWFSPDGRYLEASLYQPPSQRPQTLMFERLSDGTVLTAPGSLQPNGWTADSSIAIVMILSNFNDYLEHLALYNIQTHALTPLQAGSLQYVWTPSA